MAKILLVNSNSIKIPLADESVHCVVTSPPYWGLRDYGLPPLVWPDGWLGCLGLEPMPELYVQHLVMVFREVRRVLRSDGTVWLNLGSSYWGGKGQSGHANPEYQAKRIEAGESFSQAAAHIGGQGRTRPSDGRHSTFKPKDLVPIPWMIAMALQADGWWWRSAPPWIKLNCMPESVTDRPTTGHENWFLLTKAAKYFYDVDAVREPLTESSIERSQYGWYGRSGETLEVGARSGSSFQRMIDGKVKADVMCPSTGRNRRTTDFFLESLDALIAQYQSYLSHLRHVRDNGGMLLDEDGDPLALIFPTKPYSGAHFATFSPDLIEPMIKAGTSEYGVCPECGAQWERVIEKEKGIPASFRGSTFTHGKTHDAAAALSPVGQPERTMNTRTTGWRPTCTCYDGRYFIEFPKARRARKRYQRYASGDWWKRARKRPGRDDWPIQPAIVLDPFVGSGTTCLEARELGRNSVGLDLSFDYLHDQARTRLELDKLAAWENGKQVEANWEELPLFSM